MRVAAPRARLGAAALLAALTLAVFAPALGNGFVNYDDDTYVTDNPMVRQGLSLRTMGEALVSTDAANWHPLTWISHLIDVSLWGLDPRGHHLTSLVLHAANAVLLFLLLARLTGSTARSFVAAALFAIHPLRVESVAWVAERKDVLSTLFWFLSIGAWARWCGTRLRRDYWASLAFFALGLNAKPMLVTLPLTLLLVETWPLRRAAGWRERWIEKAPFFAVSAFSAAVTIAVQRAGGAWGGTERYAPWDRVGNALIAFTSYLVKTVWPADLAVFYPHPRGDLSWLAAAGSASLLALLTWSAFRARRGAPYWTFGWLWTSVTLLPVLGFIQVGEQALADRYTYVPLVGIVVGAVWAISEGLPSNRARQVAFAGACLALLPLGVATWRQTLVWRDSVTLFGHALEVTRHNHVAHINLGLAHSFRGDDRTAASHYEAALAIRPDNAVAHNNLGNIRNRQGRLEEAERHYRAAIAADPERAEAHGNLGMIRVRQGQIAAAIPHLTEAVRLDPDNHALVYNLGTALANAGRFDEALPVLEQAERLAPDHASTRANLRQVRQRLSGGR